MFSILGLLVPVALKFFDLYLSRAKDKKEAWEAFQKFQRELDAYRSKRIYESGKSQREKLRNDGKPVDNEALPKE
jgi:ribosomal protein S20